ncbi:MAG: hypothetical protein L3J75_13600 [Methylococcaceae bacterium]|nr:hypothetical protein [Methylococcaceae bacterium]
MILLEYKVYLWHNSAQKKAKLTKTLAPMIRSFSSKQLTIAEFDWPFQTDLDENNRWVTISQCIPWDELAEFYYQGLSVETGRPAKDARMVIGAVIIKHKLCLQEWLSTQLHKSKAC